MDRTIEVASVIDTLVTGMDRTDEISANDPHEKSMKGIHSILILSVAFVHATPASIGDLRDVVHDDA